MNSTHIELELSNDLVAQIDKVADNRKTTRSAVIEEMLTSFLGKKGFIINDEIEFTFKRLITIQERNEFKDGWVWYKLIEYFPEASFDSLKEYAMQLGLSLKWAKEQISDSPKSEWMPF